MNHLTNLYKHKCEQLQEQINNIKKMLNEVNAPDGGLPPMQVPSYYDQYGPRSIPPGEPGSQQHGPPKPRPNGPPPQPPPDATQEEWFQWLDRMWQWYIKNYPYSTTNGNGDNIQQWWRIWHDIQEIHPGQGHGWEWEDQERKKGSPPSNRPLFPPDRTKPHFDPQGP
jgi:hypothetical protein